MEKSTWTLSEREQARAAFSAAYERGMARVAEGERAVLELRPETRSDVQNAKLHAMFSDIAKWHVFNGRRMTLAQVKVLFISGHSIATGQGADLVVGLEGEAVNIRESSARMSVSRMASLIEYTAAWAANNGLELR